MEPTDRRQLVALDVPLSAPANADLGDDRALARDQAAGLGDPLAHAVGARRALRAMRSWRRSCAQRPATAGRLQPAHARAGAAMAAATRATTMRRSSSARWTGSARIRLHAGVPLAGRNAVDEFLFVDKARLLRAFQLGVRRADARRPASRRAWSPATPAASATRSATTGSCAAPMRTPGPRCGCRGAAGCGWIPTAAVAPERIYDTLADRAGRRRPARLRCCRHVRRRRLDAAAAGTTSCSASTPTASARCSALGHRRLDAETPDAAVLAGRAARPGCDGLAGQPRRARARPGAARLAPPRRAATAARPGPREPHEPALRLGASAVHRARAGGDEACAALSARFADGATLAPGQPVESLNALLRDLRAHRP